MAPIRDMLSPSAQSQMAALKGFVDFIQRKPLGYFAETESQLKRVCHVFC
jgi:hypothetical protein